MEVVERILGLDEVAELQAPRDEPSGANDGDEDDGGAKKAGVTRFVEWLAWALASWRGSGGADEPTEGGG